MNIEPPQTTSIWAKLVAMQPDNQNITLSTDKPGYPSDAKFTIYQNQDGPTFIQNLSATYLQVDDSLLEINQEYQLFGGEKLSFEQEKDHINTKCDYIFCFVHFKPCLKRERDEVIESESFSKLLKIENDLQRELTCSICTNSLEMCMVLSPCLHSFCSFCLFGHLKLSSQCPLCRVKAVSVAKSPVLSNMIHLAIDHFPSLQRPQERKEFEQINFGGTIVRNGHGAYIGSFVNGKKEGHGKFIYQAGTIYEGSWKNDVREGKGVLIMKNGDKYDGSWKNDRYHGFGKYVWSFGEEYEGDFQDAALHGFGIRKYADGNVYKGDWKNNKREGRGVLSYPCGDKYEGDFKDGCRHGHGIMKYRGGNIYKGGWKNDKREGKGIITWNNGNLCAGKWVNDVLQILVTLKYSTGEKYYGEIEVESFKRQGREIEYDSIKRQGKGILTLQNGIKQVGNWKNEILRKRFTF